jgi:TetR/AcrR family transcriptional regulator, regulator of autoinduction and epiphytic fitness
MKTTQAQQDKTRRTIIQCAVDAISADGFDNTTMKQIARAAKIGDATIYKYFPTKEKLVLGYFDQLIFDAIDATLQTPGLADYGLQEKLQRLTDAVLELVLPDREFVAQARALLGRAPLAMLGQQITGRQAMSDLVLTFFQAAEESAEMPACSFKPSLAALYNDYLFGMLAYWLNDDSDEFSDTAQFVDLSLGLLVLTLRSGVVNQALQLGGFVLRSQMARLMARGSGVLDLLRLAKQAAQASQAHSDRGNSAHEPKTAPVRKTAKAPVRRKPVP